MTETSRKPRRARKPPIELELALIDWGPRGSTTAEDDGRRMVVDRGIPGERVRATVDRGRRPWRGVVDEVLEASAQRTSPPCLYYVRGCGGCQWQHATYPFQLETKRTQVDRELEAAGLTVGVGAAHPMDDPWRYRRTAAIAIGWEAGFRPRGRRGILEIHDCLISHPLIGSLAHEMNLLLRQGKLPNYHGKVWLDCTVVGTCSEPRLQVLIQGIEGLTLETHRELPEVAGVIAAVPKVSSVAFRHRSGEPIPLVGDLMDTVEVAGRSMHLPAGSFFQTNLVMFSRLLDRMSAFLEDAELVQAADIYGGVGAIGLPLARHAERMTLVELDPLAVEAARRTSEAWGLENVSFVSRHAEHALPELPHLDLAIVDPPRSGLGGVVTSGLLTNGVPLVFYVSCSPASLVRDLAVLSPAYRVQSLEIFDFYPHTYHVESLAILRRC